MARSSANQFKPVRDSRTGPNHRSNFDNKFKTACDMELRTYFICLVRRCGILNRLWSTESDQLESVRYPTSRNCDIKYFISIRISKEIKVVAIVVKEFGPEFWIFVSFIVVITFLHRFAHSHSQVATHLRVLNRGIKLIKNHWVDTYQGLVVLNKLRNCRVSRQTKSKIK